MNKKAISMPMELIIALIVLLVVAVAVIMFSTGGVTKVGGSSSDSIDSSNLGVACQTEAANYCARNTDPTITECPHATDCPSCNDDVSCGR